MSDLESKQTNRPPLKFKSAGGILAAGSHRRCPAPTNLSVVLQIISPNRRTILNRKDCDREHEEHHGFSHRKSLHRRRLAQVRPSRDLGFLNPTNPHYTLFPSLQVVSLCYSRLPAVPRKCLLLNRLCVLITQRSLVQIQPPQPIIPKILNGFRHCLGGRLCFWGQFGRICCAMVVETERR